jgi:hypothetical protein
MFLFPSPGGRSTAESARLRRLEKKLDLVLKHLGINGEPDPGDPAQLPIQTGSYARFGASQRSTSLMGVRLRAA